MVAVEDKLEPSESDADLSKSEILKSQNTFLDRCPKLIERPD
jgi:hypothetical protein